jgi:hypothetical protein
LVRRVPLHHRLVHRENPSVLSHALFVCYLECLYLYISTGVSLSPYPFCLLLSFFRLPSGGLIPEPDRQCGIPDHQRDRLSWPTDPGQILAEGVSRPWMNGSTLGRPSTRLVIVSE